MTTTLQQQLAAIAAHSTHQLDLKAQKARHGQSLLFDARDAAGQSFETLYRLCLEGFEELCQLDARFLPFSRNLFSEQSKNEDRTSMTAHENEALDQVIDKFLGLLGGRLLLKPAMRAAEWLVRRFRVHEYNTEATLFTFLPYHTSHIFTSLLAILPEQLPPNFRFLHPYVASQQSPPRHVVVAAASNSPAFFAAFSRYVLDVAKARHQSALLLGFWASVTAQAVSGMIDGTRSGREAIRRQKEEDMLLKVLPILQSALSIKGLPELYLGSCMIMTIMATKASLSEKVLNAMMEAVATGWTDQTVEEGTMCLAVLAEEKQYLSISKGVVHTLLKGNGSFNRIERIGINYRVEKLLAGVALGSIDLIAKDQELDAARILMDALDSNVLPERYKIAVLDGALKAVYALPASERQGLIEALNHINDQEGGGLLLDAALKTAEIDIKQLDLGLTLRLQEASKNEDDDEDDTDPMLLDEKPSDLANSLLDELPEIPASDTSFLDPAQQRLYDQYYTTFLKALPSKHDISAMLDIPSLQRSACVQQPHVFSLLARVWTSDGSPSARLKALQISREWLEQARQDDQSVDMQALLPYVLAALADPIRVIRSAAAAVSLTLSSLYNSKAERAKSSVIVPTWSKNTIYGKQSSKVQWLASADAHKVLADAILPILEDCVVDPAYVVQSLATTINGMDTRTETSRKELKSALRTSFFAFLASHVVVSPNLVLKLRMLEILKKVGKAAGPSRVQILLPFTKEVLANCRGQTASSSADALCKAVVASVSHRSVEEVELLKSLAVGDICNGSDISRLAFTRLRQLWAHMKEPTQTELVEWLLETTLNGDSTEDVQSEALEVVRGLVLPTDILVQLVERLPSIAQLSGQPTSKKRRTSDLPKPGHVDKARLNVAVRRITVVLEIIESSKPGKRPQLLKGLFYLLSETHHYKTLMGSELVYLHGLLINNLLLVVNGLKTVPQKDVDRSAIRADLIVECVRTTSNTQVHQAALLLMSALASWAPDLVLHSVMPLFTFMSSTILKQGDDYSAHVTDQTVARIIPPLAASLKKRGRDLISGAAELLLSFAAAFEHIPLHRRSELFRHLIQTLGAEESLFAIVAMLVERYHQDPSVIPFISDLMNEFPGAIQLNGISRYLDLVFDTLKAKRGLSDVILGYSEKNDEQSRVATVVLLEGLASMLTQDSLPKTLAKELKKGGEDAEQLRAMYSAILEKTMQLGLQLKNTEDFYDSATNVLTSLLSLMPTGDFIESSAMLMQTGSDEIRRQVFWSLEHRVHTAKRGDTALQRTFIDVLPNCGIFVAKNQSVPTRIAAITCMDRIAEKFGKTDRTAVVQAAQTIASDAALGSKAAEGDLRRIAILCLASMVEVLGDEFIPILPKTLDTTIRYMNDAVQLDEREADVPILNAGFSFALAILDNIPWMLSGQYLDRLLVLAASSGYSQAKDFTNLAAKKVAINDFLTSVDNTWTEVVQLSARRYSAVEIHMNAVHQSVQHHTKAMILKYSQLLFKVLLHAFDLRRTLSENGAEANYDALFELVNTTTMNTILKLNDTAFRPFFIKLVEWATSTLPRKDIKGTILRAISLYSFAHTLFEQLKSLVTSYASFLLENAAQLLTSLSPEHEQERVLLHFILDALTSNFAHDQDGFWQSPAHFDAIVNPLISRLTIADVDDARAHAIPAITELAAVVQSPDLHKSMNGLIMSYMRHEKAAVRLAAVKCERALTHSLHIDWLHSLPEMLPAISELQEDDDGEVERETLRWINQIEQVTGESLDSMLA